MSEQGVWTHKISIEPVDHYAGTRHTRRTWIANLRTNDAAQTLIVSCGHSHGHRDIKVAIECGRKLSRRTFGEVPA